MCDSVEGVLSLYQLHAALAHRVLRVSRLEVLKRTWAEERRLFLRVELETRAVAVRAAAGRSARRAPAGLAGRPSCGDSRRSPPSYVDLRMILARDERGMEKKPAV